MEKYTVYGHSDNLWLLITVIVMIPVGIANKPIAIKTGRHDQQALADNEFCKPGYVSITAPPADVLSHRYKTQKNLIYKMQ